MNRDFTKKMQYLSEKKFVQRVSPEKKIPAQAVGKKKNSCKLKIPLPPHHFSNGPSLSGGEALRDDSNNGCGGDYDQIRKSCICPKIR